ncbi:MAG TPA: Fur family transcriptional regulator [Candidatus Nitrosocosmicus sp.]|nr:Fur family transcriptional regulator [Candidatus Nitrosocosmicus sp.]
MIKKILEENGVEPTLLRIAVYRIFQTSGKPIDAQEIIQTLENEYIKINRVTVFRTLNYFVEKSLIQKHEFGEGKARYELSSLPHHHHIICTDCGNVKDIEDCSVDQIASKINEDEFKIQSHRLEFFGTCSSCQ